MSPLRLAPHLWILPCLAAIASTFAVNAKRVAHVDHVTELVARPEVDPQSPTGYAGGVRMLIVPGHDDESYQWILQTQQMVADGSWRVRQVTYDNAPIGRPVQSPSIFRWWLAGAGWMDHVFTGNPMGRAIERAAVWVEPALYLITMGIAVAFAAWRFGGLSATLLALGMACLFPFHGMFIAGAPGDGGLTQALILVSVLSLLSGVFPRGCGAETRWFIGSGVTAGLALWMNPSAAIPVIVALGAGGVLAAWCERRRLGDDSADVPHPWRMWAAGGAVVALAGYFLEFAPHSLSWNTPGLVEVHPLYAIFWLGWGDLLQRLTNRMWGGRFAMGWRGIAGSVASAGAVLALPAFMLGMKSPAFLAPEAFEARLTALAGGLAAESLAAWVAHTGVTLEFWAAMLPTGFVVAAFFVIFERSSPRANATATALLILPVLVTAGFAILRLSWWNHLDTLLLALLVAMTAQGRSREVGVWRWFAWMFWMLLLLAPGMWLTQVAPFVKSREGLTAREAQSLAERDLAHWLVRRGGPPGAVVLAPPETTVSLIYHGGLSGLGTPFGENSAGFGAAVRLAAATSADEAEALARQRTLAYIAMPTWDTFLDEYARLGTNVVEHSLIGTLHAWLPPRWLEPLPYHLPQLPALRGERAVVFEVTEVQDMATSWSRLAEYFVEMGDLGLASELCRTLAEMHAEDLGGLVAVALNEAAHNQRFLLTRTLDTIEARIQEGADEGLPWDRRASLAIALSFGERDESARNQAQLCLDSATALDVRRLSDAKFATFVALCRRLGLAVEDPDVRTSVESRLAASRKE